MPFRVQKVNGSFAPLFLNREVKTENESGLACSALFGLEMDRELFVDHT